MYNTSLNRDILTLTYTKPNNNGTELTIELVATAALRSFSCFIRRKLNWNIASTKSLSLNLHTLSTAFSTPKPWLAPMTMKVHLAPIVLVPA